MQEKIRRGGEALSLDPKGTSSPTLQSPTQGHCTKEGNGVWRVKKQNPQNNPISSPRLILLCKVFSKFEAKDKVIVALFISSIYSPLYLYSLKASNTDCSVSQTS
eukprot:TRINITY_DN24662_c0_g1_i12.p1 TRINITY_DN24662_c0_g1~~TRINITY_DN24662_c0_g1_i12.p1  ORF type:complete len:105 (+),score=5.02 TRINITY_DN24662_c0_g1_i12:407-721(+)